MTVFSHQVGAGSLDCEDLLGPCLRGEHRPWSQHPVSLNIYPDACERQDASPSTNIQHLELQA